MENNKRKEGWYWCKLNSSNELRPYYFDGDFFITMGYELDDESFELINETRITTPEEPSVLTKAIELISNLQINNDSQERLFISIINILEQLKS